MKKLIASLFSTLLFLTACGTDPSISKWDQVPELLYEVDGAVYAANGTNTSRLHADEHYVFSFESGRYYYLDNFNVATGMGDLMAADGSGQLPELVDTDVCEVKMSQDGNRVLYLKNVKDGAGTLYSWRVGAKAEMLSENVPLYSDFVDGSYGFSPNGQLIYFMTAENKQYTFFVRTGQAAPENILDLDADDTLPQINNNGRVIYYLRKDNKRETFVYQNGKTESLGMNTLVIWPFADYSSILYLKDQQVYCKTAEDTVQFTSEGHVPIPRNAYSFYGDSSLMNETRFIIDPADTGQEGKVTLYEFDVTQPEKLIKIAIADVDGYIIDRAFSNVLFSLDGQYYIAHKSEDGWGEPQEIELNCEGFGSACMFLLSYVSFDSTGRYCYYASIANEEERTLKLIKYDIKLNTATDIFSGVLCFWLTKDIPFLCTEDDELYRADTGELITDQCRCPYLTLTELYFRSEDGALYHYDASHKKLAKLSDDIGDVRYDGNSFGEYETVIPYECEGY